MPQDLGGTSYEDFLKKQVEVVPPTPAEVELSENPKTSRSDPPKDLPTT